MVSKESRWKKFFGSRLFLFVAAVIVFMVIFGYVRAYYQDYQVRQEITRLEEQARNLEAKKLELLEVLKYVKSDSFVEEKARIELNMLKQGERVMVVASSTAPNEHRQEKNNMLEWTNLSNYAKWWRFFVNSERWRI